MSEWLKEHAWKACVGETLPRVRIPLSPPVHFHCFSSAFRTKSTRDKFSPASHQICAEMLSTSVISQAEITQVTFSRDISILETSASEDSPATTRRARPHPI